jgi:cyanophycinase
MPHTGDVFLIGGGWSPDAHPLTLGSFAQAAGASGTRRIVLVTAHDDEVDPLADRQRYLTALGRVDVPEAEVAHLVVSPDEPLTAGALESAGVTGLLVGGGLTPDYQRALCLDLDWLRVLRGAALPYAGFSAGSAIAATRAVVGGWRMVRDGRAVPVGADDIGEDLDLVETVPGLGLVPFAVDVHASQWGTLARALHTVDAGLVAEAWAIDEDTCVHIAADGTTAVRGLGSAYRITSQGGTTTVDVRVATSA